MFHSPTQSQIDKAKELLAKPENEQLAQFLKTTRSQHAKNYRGMIQRFHNWQRTLREIAEAKIEVPAN